MLADRERGLLFQNDFNFITDREEVLVSLCNGALETNSYYNRGNLFSLLLQFMGSTTQHRPSPWHHFFWAPNARAGAGIGIGKLIFFEFRSCSGW
jgi:hypothetical protein